MRHALVGAAHAELAAGELQVVLAGLEQVRRDRPRLLDDLVGGVHDGDAADHERARAVGVQALVRDLGVAVQHLDVLERDAEPVGDDLAERRLVALPVRAGAGQHLDLAGGQHPDGRRLPAAADVAERAQHPGRREPAHLGERGDAQPELDGVTAVPALLLLGAQRVVAEQLLGLLGGRLVVAGVVLQPGDRGERELLVLDPVLLAHLERVAAQLGGELVHHPLDAEGGLGPAGAAVGVGPGLVGEHVRAGEPVRRELVDGVEHERAQDRHARGDQAQVGAHVGQQVDLEAGDRAVLGGGQGEPLDLVAPVVRGQDRLGAGLGALARLAEPPGHQERDRAPPG